MERLKQTRWTMASAMLGLYILALPFHRSVWKLPRLGSRVQPAELMLAVLAAFVLVRLVSGRTRFWFSPLDAPVLLWLAANIVGNLIVGFDGRLIMETAKVAAVVLVYFSFRLLASGDFLGRLADLFLLSALITSLLAIAGSVLSLFGMRTALAVQMVTYPYLGAIGRAAAFTSTPNMLGSILMTALLLKAAQWLDEGRARKRDAAAAVCLLAFVAAVSKTILCFLLGLAVLALLRPNRQARPARIAAVIAIILLAALYLAGSHFVLSRSLTPQVRANMEQGHVTRTVHRLGPLLAIETSYMTIKRSSLRVLADRFPLGVGTRSFKALVPSLKQKGIYNRETEDFDPHCTPLGTLVELGLAGGAALLLLFLAVLYALRSLRRTSPPRFQPMVTAMIALFAALCLEAWVTDIMNFRHYWLLLGVLAWLLRPGSRAEKPAA